MKALGLPFDPLGKSLEVANLVMDSGRRKYYRFRPGEFYGGIVTADAVGCTLKIVAARRGGAAFFNTRRRVLGEIGWEARIRT